MKTIILTIIMLAASTASADLLWKDSFRFRKVSQAEISASLQQAEERRAQLTEQESAEDKTVKGLLAELVEGQKQQNQMDADSAKMAAQQAEAAKQQPTKLIQSLGPMSRAMERIVKTLSVPELKRLVEIRGAKNSEI
ncbi:MAG: hypothetical protein HRT45_07025 [Bdellovibrionales bacterium]|nr:hypothetical protein [Bdellovibrionales bacterium]